MPLQKVSSVDLKELAAKNPEHWKKAAAIRALTLDAVAAANSGHSGMAMGMADVATVLFEKHMKFDASAPNWPDRDRFILSAGHGSMLLYALLHLTGYADMTLDEIKTSANGAQKPPDIQNMAMPRALRPPLDHSAKGLPIRWALPLPKKYCAPPTAKKFKTIIPMSSPETVA